MNYVDLGQRVRATRKKQAMTQEQLAEKVGISSSFLGHIERGTRAVSVDTLVALCNVLSVRADYLLGASLTNFDSCCPEGLMDEDRKKLTDFLQVALDTANTWNQAKSCKETC
ncbi:MAG: helix-turn-helix transcriptional regulator [Clostridia bacterium]|nr:helix-turn-helix transcriptional regulator [Clostridia bacterium]